MYIFLLYRAFDISRPYHPQFDNTIKSTLEISKRSREQREQYYGQSPGS